jgi:hypothetical protein
LERLSSVFPDLLDWMNLKYLVVPELQRFNAAKRERCHWSQWSSSERAMFSHWCGGLMDRFYPTWRLGEDWKDIEYHPVSGRFGALRSNYRVVKSINGLLARNRSA